MQHSLGVVVLLPELLCKMLKHHFQNRHLAFVLALRDLRTYVSHEFRKNPRLKILYFFRDRQASKLFGFEALNQLDTPYVAIL